MLWFKFGESIHLRYGAIMNHKIECEKQHWTKKNCYVVNVDFNSIDGLMSMWNLPKIMGDFDASVVKNLLHFPPEANCMDIKMIWKLKAAVNERREIKSFPITKKRGNVL